MSRVVFDIETIGVEFESLNEEDQAYILKSAEDEKKTKEIKGRLGLWPFTGEIAAICLFNPDTKRGKTFFQAPNEKLEPFIEEDIEYEALTEKEILTKFWQEMRNHEKFITFNGRGFDCPYIMLRSAVHKVKPTRNLMPYRYDANIHVDLLDQLTFYGAFRKFSLDFYCKQFNLDDKKLEGMSGAKVQNYFKDGKYLDIARYCSYDVKATAGLYEHWEKYIRI